MRNPPPVTLIFFLAAGAMIAGMIWAANSGGGAPRGIETLAESAPQSRNERIAALAADWPREPDYAPIFNALDPSFAVIETSASAFDPGDDYFGLPRTEGYETVYAYCGACHSLRIVMQQHVTPERWSEILIWMSEKQGMPELPPEDAAIVLDYLSEHFGSAG